MTTNRSGRRNNHIKTQHGKGFETSEDSEIKKLKISDLILDNRNTNKGTQLGKELLKTSVSRYGAGRGVLVDRNLKLIAGNHSVGELKRQGIEEIIVVQTFGRQLVVTQRMDIDKDSKEGHELAIADNRVGQANLDFDVDVIKELDAEFCLDLDDFAININDTALLFPNDGELDPSDQMETSYKPSNAKGTGVSEEKQGQFDQSFFPLAIALTKAERLTFDKWKKDNNVHTDTEGFQLMFKKVKNL